MVRYSTALSHIFLGGTAFYTMLVLNQVLEDGDLFPLTYFGLIAFHSLIGVWRWGNPQFGYLVEKYYNMGSEMLDFVVLPCITSCLWFKYNYYSSELAITHTAVALVPLLVSIWCPKIRKIVGNVIVIGNLISLVVVSFLNENYYGFTCTLSYILSYFLIKQDVLFNVSIEVPTLDLYNYSMCFFIYFALKAVLAPNSYKVQIK